MVPRPTRVGTYVDTHFRSYHKSFNWSTPLLVVHLSETRSRCFLSCDLLLLVIINSKLSQLLQSLPKVLFPYKNDSGLTTRREWIYFLLPSLSSFPRHYPPSLHIHTHPPPHNDSLPFQSQSPTGPRTTLYSNVTTRVGTSRNNLCSLKHTFPLITS